MLLIINRCIHIHKISEKAIIDEYVSEITISQSDIIANIKRNDLNPMTPFSTEPQEFMGD